MPLILGSNSASGGYNVANSLRFNSASSDNLSRTPSTNGNLKTWTWSTWIKFSKLATNGARQYLFSASDNSTDTAGIYYGAYVDQSLTFESGAISLNLRGSVNLFRDVSAWYNIVAVLDTTQATSTNRAKIYVNNTLITSYTSLSNYPSQNADSIINSTGFLHSVGSYYGSNHFFDGYIAETYLIDGQALDPTSFGETDTLTGIWKPKAYTGSFGTNGFYQKYANSAALGTDSSGNGNTYTVNNLTSVDQSTDTCTNNFCTLNAIQNGNGTTVTLSEGNLVAGSGDNKGCSATFGVNRGKWYWEIKTVGSTYAQRVGVSNRANEQDGDVSPGTDTANVRSWCGNGAYKNYSASSSSADAAFVSTSGAIYAFGLDLNNGTLARYVNGVLINTDTTLPSDNSVTFFPFTFVTNSGGGGWNQAQFNFGSPMYTGGGYADAAGFGNFSYAVPAGYYSLCTKNLANFG